MDLHSPTGCAWSAPVALPSTLEPLRQPHVRVSPFQCPALKAPTASQLTVYTMGAPSTPPWTVCPASHLQHTARPRGKLSEPFLEAWFTIGATPHVTTRQCGLPSSAALKNQLGQAHECAPIVVVTDAGKQAALPTWRMYSFRSLHPHPQQPCTQSGNCRGKSCGFRQLQVPRNPERNPRHRVLLQVSPAGHV